MRWAAVSSLFLPWCNPLGGVAHLAPATRQRARPDPTILPHNPTARSWQGMGAWGTVLIQRFHGFLPKDTCLPSRLVLPKQK